MNAILAGVFFWLKPTIKLWFEAHYVTERQMIVISYYVRISQIKEEDPYSSPFYSKFPVFHFIIVSNQKLYFSIQNATNPTLTALSKYNMADMRNRQRPRTELTLNSPL